MTTRTGNGLIPPWRGLRKDRMADSGPAAAVQSFSSAAGRPAGTRSDGKEIVPAPPRGQSQGETVAPPPGGDHGFKSRWIAQRLRMGGWRYVSNLLTEKS